MGKQKVKKPGYWDNIKNIQKHLKKIIKKNGGNFPTKEQLRAFPYGLEIETAIMRLGMTLDEFRMQMGIKSSNAEEQDQMLDLLMSSTESFLQTVRERKRSMATGKIDPLTVEPELDVVVSEQPPAEIALDSETHPEADISDLVPSSGSSLPKPKPLSKLQSHAPQPDLFQQTIKEPNEKKGHLHDTFALFETKLKKYSDEEE
ncbi:MAG: hypothetical protein ACTSRW_12285 [Candidatus Helarchaeota archaeon]